MAEPLFARSLVLVAHQDDESLGAGVLLNRAEKPTVVFATDGASEDPYFWKAHGSRQRLARVREEEAHAALAIAGVDDVHFLGFRDQTLHRHAYEAVLLVVDIARQSESTALLTHAYEGGHPDHDTCSYIAYIAGRELGIPVWEMPLYHRAQDVSTKQQFLHGEADLMVIPNEEESTRKRQMLAAYASQGDLTAAFPAITEIFRTQPQYDYTRPPHAGVLNYEAWQWAVTGMEVSRALAGAMGGPR